MYRIRKYFRPDIFQGKYKRCRFFEGWYFKITDASGQYSLAVIPGIAIDDWDTHAFIQIIDSNQKISYFHYDIKEFSFNEHEFEIMVGDNYFTKDRIRLNIVGKEITIQGDVNFYNTMEFPRSLIRPGVMGLFLFIPWMECYHDIICIKSTTTGQLKINGKDTDFNNGIGYIEKNWGKSMPKAWIWFQSNHFEVEDVSLVICVGDIPFMGTSFQGFLVLFRYKDRIIMFTTYNGSWIRQLYEKDDTIYIALRDCRFKLSVKITKTAGSVLMAPKKGKMSRGITESIQAKAKVKLTDKKGNVLYEGTGTNGGLETVG